VFVSESPPAEREEIHWDLDQLEKLAALKEKGVVTEDEFQIKKKELLGYC